MASHIADQANPRSEQACGGTNIVQPHALVASQLNLIALNHQGFKPLLALARPLLLPFSSAQLQGLHS